MGSLRREIYVAVVLVGCVAIEIATVGFSTCVSIRGGDLRMREKLSNILTIRLTDSDLVRFIALMEKVQSGHVVTVRPSAFAASLVVRALDAADKSKSFPSHFPPAEGKILRVKRSQLRQRASRVA
jgi:hypothetical protein